ncbi:MAG: SAF domain-containing protein [Propionibacterium sp.]|nr:SAF domain-containing protein [Propionibacterium sp.]
MTITQRRVRSRALKAIEPEETSQPLGSHPAEVRLRARRSPRLIALGILVAALGGLGGAALLTTSTHTRSVLVMARPVARGDLIEASDLAVATIGPAPGVRTVPASDLSRLVGRTARVDLPAGSLPGPDAAGDPLVPADYAQVGLRLEAGRLPVSELPPGTAIQLVPVSATAGDPAPDVTPVRAVVVQPARGTDTGSAMVLDVAVPSDKAVEVAQLAARGEVAVVRVGQA